MRRQSFPPFIDFNRKDRKGERPQMELQIDLTKEYGIVLEGGGAKGSYQIGAWKALREAGVSIRGIAGSSVGALNGALMCMDDLEGAEDIWSNIEYSRVMNVNDETMKALKRKDFKALNMQEIFGSGLQVIKDGGFDVTPLKTLIADTVDEAKIRDSDRELFVVTYSVSDRRELDVDVKKAEPGTVKDMLLASAYFLAFKNEKLGGKRYMDGGGFNNVPVNVLLDRGYEDVIVIRIYGWGFDSEKVLKVPEGVNLYHIAPRQSLGGILEFDKRQSRKNMVLGYYDAKRFLYGLDGRSYYIDAPYQEAYYFERMMAETELVRACLMAGDGLQEEDRDGGYRMYTEKWFPRLAAQLKLKDGWNYKDLYLSVLEDLAKQMRFKRFKIYTVEEMVRKIYRKLRALDSVPPL